MAITPVQPNINNTNSHKYYLEKEGSVQTNNNVKPLPPKGHLVHDRLLVMPKFFFKDIAYDLKSIRDGLRGEANDHKTGRLNDVGLKLGGIGIATILASRTTNPVARIMEYAGLGGFLFAMNVYPKIAIQAPARAIHGFDTGIEYIDDQGRKKSMFQDQNYLPFDMYQGETSSENLDIIGDRLGIPRDINNRHAVIKEQMRKISIQNNTMWMLTAGFATPVIAAITCHGLEKLIAPALEKVRNIKHNNDISNILKKTSEMSLDVDKIETNKLSKNVEKLLETYKDKELPKTEYEKLVNLLTKDIDANASEGIKADLQNIFGRNVYSINENEAEQIIERIKTNIPKNNEVILKKVFVPTKDEISQIINNKQVGPEDLYEIKGKFKQLFNSKIAQQDPKMKEFLEAQANIFVDDISKQIQAKPSRLLNENNIKEITNFAKILGDFKINDKVLDKSKSFKFEHTSETVIARAYEKFEKTLLNVLDIKYNDLKQMRHSADYTKEIVDKKLEALVKDKAKYEKAISKLSKVMAEMDNNLHGTNEQGSYIKDLITAIENNYNNTAKRLDEAGQGKFKNTIDKLVKEDVKTLSNSLDTRENTFKFLDGLKAVDSSKVEIEYVKENAKGVGSSKNQAISRIFERYQGANNSFNRILHLADIYNKGIPEGEYNKQVYELGKNAVMGATTTEQTLKLNLVNNHEMYKDVMKNTWKEELSEATKNGFDTNKQSNINERFVNYLKRFQNIFANDSVDFTKPNHKINENVLSEYTKSSKTRMSKFNLMGQSPVELIQQAAEKRYANQKWMRIVSVIGGAVLGTALIAQFTFGKLSNPHNLKKQVSDVDNK